MDVSLLYNKTGNINRCNVTEQRLEQRRRIGVAPAAVQYAAKVAGCEPILPQQAPAGILGLANRHLMDGLLVFNADQEICT